MDGWFIDHIVSPTRPEIRTPGTVSDASPCPGGHPRRHGVSGAKAAVAPVPAKAAIAAAVAAVAVAAAVVAVLATAVAAGVRLPPPGARGLNRVLVVPSGCNAPLRGL